MVWADMVARRLLADFATGKCGPIDGDAVQAACDAQVARIIGQVDRVALVDHTARRVAELAAAAGIVPGERRAPLSGGTTCGGNPGSRC